MLINNVDINIYNAILNSKNISVSEIENNILLLKNNTAIKLNNKYKLKKIELKLTLEGENEDIINTNISNITKEMIDCIIEFNNSKYKYKAFLQESVPKKIYRYAYELDVTLIGYAYTDIVIEDLNRILTKTITNTGNIDTPCTVEITPSIDIIDIKIEGLSDEPITIKNLKQNTPVIIDGESCLVIENGINKFSDTDMWEFPRLKPGANIIKLSKDSCDITIKYKPRYI